MSKHTKEPWSWQAKNKNVAYLTEHDDATIIVRLSGDDNTNSFSRVSENASRIVACVNACEGIDTDELNEYCVVSAKEYQEIERQRDELLVALEDIAKWTERYTKPDHHIVTVARRAIASVKGGAA